MEVLKVAAGEVRAVARVVVARVAVMEAAPLPLPPPSHLSPYPCSSHAHAPALPLAMYWS